MRLLAGDAFDVVVPLGSGRPIARVRRRVFDPFTHLPSRPSHDEVQIE